MAIIALKPQDHWLSSFLEPSLIEAPPYKIDTPLVDIKLDQNESPWDWPLPIKQKITDRLLNMSWNRYPSAFTDTLADKIGQYAGVAKEQVLLGPGSNYLVSLVLSVFTRSIREGLSKGKVVIARPSFALYESHCRYDGIPYHPWLLNQDLEYDESLLPDLPPGSVVMFASPNNPVVNALSYDRFKALLTRYPDTLWIADEAYCEYAKEPYTKLLSEHANLLLIRTFSKTLGCAGVRIGFILGHTDWLTPLKKLRLPYLLNHFAIAAADVLLEDSATKEHLANIQTNAVIQREFVCNELNKLARDSNFTVKPSLANFLLLRWPDNATASAFYQKLIDAGILVRNVMAAPGLSGCLRITIGTEEENQRLLEAFNLIIHKSR